MLKVVAITTLASLVLTAPTDKNLDFSPINQFALKLLDNTFSHQELLGNSNANIAISPLSIWSIFSLLAEGSTGDTFEELIQTLQLPMDLRVTQALHLAVNSIIQSNSQDVVLKGFKTMLTDCSLEIHPEFCEAAKMYNTQTYSVAIDKNNTAMIADRLNYFICVATEGRILDAVKPDILEDLRMILIDALYFKASWTHSFDPTQTKQESFYNTQGKRIGAVNMMYHKAPHNIGDSNQIGAQILEMTYGKDERFAVLVLVPFDGMPLKRLLNNLASQELNWMNEFKLEGDLPNVDVYVPRFKISAQTDLIQPLQYTGIHSIFDDTKAQLPGVSDTPLYVSKAIQNVVIDVNEEGTVAASVTIVGLENRILGQRFEANKEFVFLIVERRSNVIVFAGVYSDPSAV